MEHGLWDGVSADPSVGRSRGWSDFFAKPWWLGVGAVLLVLIGLATLWFVVRPLKAPDSVAPSSSLLSGLDGVRGVSARVNGTDQVKVFGGPSDVGNAYPRPAALASGSPLKLECSLYGSPVGPAANKLWYFAAYGADGTGAGWLPDDHVGTGQAGTSVTPTCTGNVREPIPGAGSANPSAGPYPVIADEGATIDVTTAADPAAARVGVLHAGDIVDLRCSVAASPVAAPKALGPGASNNDWDEIAEPVHGWIPDSDVASHSSKSTAPRCS